MWGGGESYDLVVEALAGNALCGSARWHSGIGSEESDSRTGWDHLYG